MAGLRASSFDLSVLTPGQVGYNAAKHGVVGIMRDFAVALGPHGIRVNTVHPVGVRTPMVVNEALPAMIKDAPPGWMANVMGLDLLEPQDVTDAVLWLLSDAARYITGTSIPIDAGTNLI
jgi:NAD(P)-dependent dehydrogenase (short-subunit alcohol dehydrogenase family)